jgi:hypothetical protein
MRRESSLPQKFNVLNWMPALDVLLLGVREPKMTACLREFQWWT